MSAFHGKKVVRAVFVMAVFGWGVGFYGPPIFLYEVMKRTAWSLNHVSSAVTLHFLVGAMVITQLPKVHRHAGVGSTAVAGAALTAMGLWGWALAGEPWQLWASALATGAGWVTMGAVAVNAVISTWFDRDRPAALTQAYNGAAMGGVIFSPLWVLLIQSFGFAGAATLVGALMIAVMACLAFGILGKTPADFGQQVDGSFHESAGGPARRPGTEEAPPTRLWRNRQFLTLAVGMALGLFAQIGMYAHLFTLLVPFWGKQRAGLLMGFLTVCAIAGRMLVARFMKILVDRRVLAGTGYAIQALGLLLLAISGGTDIFILVLGMAMFGSGNGNSTSLPPLIAQKEFARQEGQRVVALIAGLAQAAYSFAPAFFGMVLSWGTPATAAASRLPVLLFLVAMGFQWMAMVSLLAGRPRRIDR